MSKENTRMPGIRKTNGMPHVKVVNLPKPAKPTDKKPDAKTGN